MAGGQRPASIDNPLTGTPSGIMPRTARHGWKAGSCSVCMLPDEQLLALNLILADPTQWPKTIFAGIKLPKGALPPGYRLWGALRMGQEFCREQGLVINDKALRKHYNNHVVQVPASATHFAEQGMVAAQDSKLARPDLGLTPIRFRDFYSKGVELGQRGLELLLDKIEAIEKKKGEVPVDLMLKAAEIGTKLATSAAQLEMRGFELERHREEETEGFRAGSMPLPSERMGHHRIRVIEGVARPVADEGRSDRRDYNERAEEEGQATLPA
jgi:hypothetical protein